MSESAPGPSPRATVAAFLVLTLALAAATALLLASRPAPVHITVIPPGPTATPGPSPTPAPLTVYLTGALAGPQRTLALPRGSRVEDALRLAGVGANADLTRVNLASLLRDGDHIHVPALGEEAPALPTSNTAGMVHVNTATADDLQRLPHIGVALADAIVAYREAHGPFLALDDLDAVDGIGPETLEDIAPLVLFD